MSSAAPRSAIAPSTLVQVRGIGANRIPRSRSYALVHGRPFPGAGPSASSARCGRRPRCPRLRLRLVRFSEEMGVADHVQVALQPAPNRRSYPGQDRSGGRHPLHHAGQRRAPSTGTRTGHAIQGPVAAGLRVLATLVVDAALMLRASAMQAASGAPNCLCVASHETA